MPLGLGRVGALGIAPGRRAFFRLALADWVIFRDQRLLSGINRRWRCRVGQKSRTLTSGEYVCARQGHRRLKSVACETQDSLLGGRTIRYDFWIANWRLPEGIYVTIARGGRIVLATIYCILTDAEIRSSFLG